VRASSLRTVRRNPWPSRRYDACRLEIGDTAGWKPALLRCAEIEMLTSSRYLRRSEIPICSSCFTFGTPGGSPRLGRSNELSWASTSASRPRCSRWIHLRNCTRSAGHTLPHGRNSVDGGNRVVAALTSTSNSACVKSGFQQRGQNDKKRFEPRR